MRSFNTPCRGHCTACNTTHSLPVEPALAQAAELMRILEATERLDFEQPASTAARVNTEYLYGDARGKMFGVLVCEKRNGEQLTLKAFSGQYNGIWDVEGWVPPLFDVQDFWNLLTPVEKQIKTLGKEMDTVGITSDKGRTLQQQRKGVSQRLMKAIHRLYRLHNFNNQQCLLTDLFPHQQGIPTGTGDCCAPKLLNFAALHNLRPVGLAEFYWGKTNRSATRHQGQFYPACTDKCGPLLGFLLCGINPAVYHISRKSCSTRPPLRAYPDCPCSSADPAIPKRTASESEAPRSLPPHTPAVRK